MHARLAAGGHFLQDGEGEGGRGGGEHNLMVKDVVVVNEKGAKVDGAVVYPTNVANGVLTEDGLKK